MHFYIIFYFYACMCKNNGTICGRCHIIHLCCGMHSLWRPFSHLIHTVLDICLLTGLCFVLMLHTQQSFLAGSFQTCFELLSSFHVPDFPAALFLCCHSLCIALTVLFWSPI
jgi:hypothetical protein